MMIRAVVRWSWDPHQTVSLHISKCLHCLLTCSLHSALAQNLCYALCTSSEIALCTDSQQIALSSPHCCKLVAYMPFVTFMWTMSVESLTLKKKMCKISTFHILRKMSNSMYGFLSPRAIRRALFLQPSSPVAPQLLLNPSTIKKVCNAAQKLELGGASSV